MDSYSGKILMVIAGIVAACLVYRTIHPSTKFAVDGTDERWDTAVRLSQESGQPAVVMFTAGWCGACQALHQNVLSRSDVKHELFSHYVFYTVDMTNPSPEVQARVQSFGVSAIPTLIRYDKNGNETDRANYLNPDQMIAWLKAGE
jgi:thiol:disulfide interchange protein DsbD